MSNAREAELERLLEDARSEILHLTRTATDRLYMMAAYHEMLGPKGLEVVAMWRAKNVQRHHTSWGPEVWKLSGEERAQVLLDAEKATCRSLDFSDGKAPRAPRRQEREEG